MRKLLRQIARYKMTKAGIQHPNKRPYVLNPESHMMERADSYFSQNWRKFAAM